MISIKRKAYFALYYCVSFFFLIFDTFIGLFQLIDIIHGGNGLLNTGEGQFRLTNLLVDLITLIVMSLFLLVLWRRLFIQTNEEEIMSYSRIFVIMAVVGGIIVFLALFLVSNPFLIDLNLRVNPLGHIYDIMIKVGSIFFFLGIVGILSIKIERYRLDNLNE